MPDIALAAESRAERGSSASRRARAAGRVPAVIYGHGHDPIAISVDARELRVALNSLGSGNVLFNVRVDDAEHLAIAREVQRHPVRHTVSHVDFQVVSRDELVPADVPIHLVGDTAHITRAGGSVEHALLSLRVHAKPADIPAAIEVDVEKLELGASLRVADLVLPRGVTSAVEGETPVVVAQISRGAELGEGEEGEGADTAASGGQAAGEDAADEASEES